MNIDQEYKFNKIDALSQFHIVRRLAPVVGELFAAVANSGLTANGKKAEDMKFNDIDFDAVSKNLSPVMIALSKLPDEDMNYCLFGLLKGVQRKQIGGGFANVMANGSKDLIMFEDIKENLQLMLTLAGKSIAVNLGGFMQALPSALKEGALHQNVSG